GVPEWPKGTGCKPVGSAYGGSNPPAPTRSDIERLRAVRDDVGTQVRALGGDVLRFLGHPDVRPPRPKRLTGARDAAAQTDVVRRFDPDRDVPVRSELAARGRDAFDDQRPADRDVVPLRRSVRLPVVALVSAGLIGQDRLENLLAHPIPFPPAHVRPCEAVRMPTVAFGSTRASSAANSDLPEPPQPSIATIRVR